MKSEHKQKKCLGWNHIYDTKPKRKRAGKKFREPK